MTQTTWRGRLESFRGTSIETAKQCFNQTGVIELPALRATEIPAPAAGELPAGELPTLPAGELPAGELPALPAGELPAPAAGELPAGELPAGELPALPAGELPAGDLPAPAADELPAAEGLSGVVLNAPKLALAQPGANPTQHPHIPTRQRHHLTSEAEPPLVGPVSAPGRSPGAHHPHSMGPPSFSIRLSQLLPSQRPCCRVTKKNIHTITDPGCRKTNGHPLHLRPDSIEC